MLSITKRDYVTPHEAYKDYMYMYYRSYGTYLADLRRAERSFDHNWYGFACEVAHEHVCWYLPTYQ